MISSYLSVPGLGGPADSYISILERRFLSCSYLQWIFAIRDLFIVRSRCPKSQSHADSCSILCCSRDPRSVFALLLIRLYQDQYILLKCSYLEKEIDLNLMLIC